MRIRGTSPTLTVSNSYLPMLLDLREFFGGTIRSRKSSFSNRRHYEWGVCGDKTRKVLRLLLPYLREKRAQADILLQWHLYPPHSEMRTAMQAHLALLKRLSYTREDT